jgi:hypothetical protein
MPSDGQGTSTFQITRKLASKKEGLEECSDSI